MASVVVTASARADLHAMIRTHSLPSSTVERVRASLVTLADLPQLGPALAGRWTGFRFVLGPWPWMLLVYVWDEEAHVFSVVTWDLRAPVEDAFDLVASIADGSLRNVADIAAHLREWAATGHDREADPRPGVRDPVVGLAASVARAAAN